MIIRRCELIFCKMKLRSVCGKPWVWLLPVPSNRRMACLGVSCRTPEAWSRRRWKLHRRRRLHWRGGVAGNIRLEADVRLDVSE